MPTLEVFDSDGAVMTFTQDERGVSLAWVADRAAAWVGRWLQEHDLVATTSRGLVWTSGMNDNLDIVWARLLLVPGLTVKQDGVTLTKGMRTAPAWVVRADQRRLLFEKQLMGIYRQALEELDAGNVADSLPVLARLHERMLAALKQHLDELRIAPAIADKAMADMETYLSQSLLPALRIRIQDAWTEHKQVQKAGLPGTRPAVLPDWLGGWGRRIQHSVPTWLSGLPTPSVLAGRAPVSYAHINQTPRIPFDLWEDFDPVWTAPLQGLAWRVATYAAQLWIAQVNDQVAGAGDDMVFRFTGPMDDQACTDCADKWEVLYYRETAPRIGDSACNGSCRHWLEAVPANEVNPMYVH